MRMRILPLLAVAAFAAAPALAQDEPDHLATVAAVIGGFADGSTFSLGPQGDAKVTAGENGVFTGTATDGSSMTLTVAEPEECVFTVHIVPPEGGEATLKFDFNTVGTIIYTESADSTPLNDFSIALEGNDTTVQMQQAGGEYQSAGNSSSLNTSLTQAELEAAAEDLKGFCPGMTG